MIRKHLVIAVLAIFCLTSTLFIIIPTSGSPDAGDYDPWLDINDDGKIDMKDVGAVCRAFGTKGEPINKTALCLICFELNDTVVALQSDVAFLLTKIGELEASLVEHQSRIAELETELAILNATKLGEPDYDSNWASLAPIGDNPPLEHNLGTTEVIVYIVGKKTWGGAVHQVDYGGYKGYIHYRGVYWYKLTETEVTVHRHGDDENWEYVRVMIWKLPEP
jgi:hypothetical protein